MDSHANVKGVNVLIITSQFEVINYAMNTLNKKSMNLEKKSYKVLHGLHLDMRQEEFEIKRRKYFQHLSERSTRKIKDKAS